MKDSEIAEKAIGELRERGWTRGTMVDTAGHVCLAGAVVAAVSGEEPHFYRSNPNVQDRASRFVDKMSAWMGYGAISWNDTKALDVDAVIEKLKLFGEYRAGKGD